MRRERGKKYKTCYFLLKTSNYVSDILKPLTPCITAARPLLHHLQRMLNIPAEVVGGRGEVVAGGGGRGWMDVREPPYHHVMKPVRGQTPGSNKDGL